MAAAPPVLLAAEDEAADAAEATDEVAEAKTALPELNTDENEDCNPANSDDSDPLKSDPAVDCAAESELSRELIDARIDDASAAADDNAAEAEVPVIMAALPCDELVSMSVIALDTLDM